MKQLIKALLLGALIALLYVGYTTLTGNCERRGGTLVKTLVWYECAVLERR